MQLPSAEAIPEPQPQPSAVPSVPGHLGGEAQELDGGSGKACIGLDTLSSQIV